MSVVIETTLGDITVDLYLAQRPVTCLNFLKLCKMKYYNFNLFHSIRSGFIAQTGDPTAEGSGGMSVFGVLEGPGKRFFSGEKLPKIRHTNTGTLSMVCTGDMMVGSQFFFTLAPDLDSLDSVHCVIGEVTEGHDILRMLNDVICDESHRPYRDVRITHTVVLEDPFNDPPGLRAPSRSPSPSAERLKGGRIAPDEDIDDAQGKSVQEIQELIAEKEAKARATILEIVGDLPDAEIAPPENVLFVCKLNPVTTDEDLEIIFSRFGKIVGCEVIRDKKTSDSLQYAFIEFSDKKSCEDAYFKMDNVLIDDRRIHVDFSQSVSRMRWMGKGKGIKYFNNNESKDETVNNHSAKQQNKDRDRGDHTNGRMEDHHKDKRDRDSRPKRNDRHKRSDRDRSQSRRHRSRSRSRAKKSRDLSRHRTDTSRHSTRNKESRSDKRGSNRDRSLSRSRRDKSSRHRRNRSRSTSRRRSSRSKLERSRDKKRSRSRRRGSQPKSSKNERERSTSQSKASNSRDEFLNSKEKSRIYNDRDHKFQESYDTINSEKDCTGLKQLEYSDSDTLTQIYNSTIKSDATKDISFKHLEKNHIESEEFQLETVTSKIDDDKSNQKQEHQTSLKYPEREHAVIDKDEYQHIEKDTRKAEDNSKTNKNWKPVCSIKYPEKVHSDTEESQMQRDQRKTKDCNNEKQNHGHSFKHSEGECSDTKQSQHPDRDHREIEDANKSINKQEHENSDKYPEGDHSDTRESQHLDRDQRKIDDTNKKQDHENPNKYPEGDHSDTRKHEHIKRPHRKDESKKSKQENKKQKNEDEKTSTHSRGENSDKNLKARDARTPLKEKKAKSSKKIDKSKKKVTKSLKKKRKHSTTSESSSESSSSSASSSTSEEERKKKNLKRRKKKVSTSSSSSSSTSSSSSSSTESSTSSSSSNSEPSKKKPKKVVSSKVNKCKKTKKKL